MKNNVPKVARAGKEVIQKEGAAAVVSSGLIKEKEIAEQVNSIPLQQKARELPDKKEIPEKKGFLATLWSDNLIAKALTNKNKKLVDNPNFVKNELNDREFVTESYIRQRFETVSLIEYSKVYTTEEIQFLKENRIQFILRVREECLKSKDIKEVAKVLSEFFDPNQKETGFFFGFCVDLTSEVLSKGYHSRVISNKISAVEMYDLIQKNTNQSNLVLTNIKNLTVEEDVANALSPNSFQRALEIKDAVHLARNNPEKSVHIVFDKDVSKVLKKLNIEHFNINNDGSNKNYDFLFIDYETKTVRFMDSKSVDLHKAISQLKKGYLNCVFGVGVVDEKNQAEFSSKKISVEISPEIHQQLINSTNNIYGYNEHN